MFISDSEAFFPGDSMLCQSGVEAITASIVTVKFLNVFIPSRGIPQLLAVGLHLLPLVSQALARTHLLSVSEDLTVAEIYLNGIMEHVAFETGFFPSTQCFFIMVSMQGHFRTHMMRFSL